MIPLDPTPAVLPFARETMRKHARSFRIAARLLSAEDADDAALTYAFCREADDLVDEAPSVEAATTAIDELRAELRGRRRPRPLVVAFYRMALRRRLPIDAAWTLVDTIADDAGPVRISDDPALLRYAYGVAGTVGLMMASLLGARTQEARTCAIDLGIGMQLSNVARDVTEDARRDRLYLPAERLRALGVDPEDVVAGTADPEQLATVSRDLVALADRYYASALDGLGFLPLRGRLAVAVAASLYQAIGHAVVRRGALALRGRTVLGRLSLGTAVLRGLLTAALPRVWGGSRSRDPALHPFSLGAPESGTPCPTA